MVSTRTFSLAVLQIGAAAAKCYRGCSPDNDALLELLGAEPDAVSFCSEFLGIGTTTVESTVTLTVTVSSTVTEIETSSAPSASPSAPPVPQVVTKRAKIQIYRVSTQSYIGYVYMSSGPAVTSDPNVAATFRYNLTAGAASASQVRFEVEGYAPASLGFNVPAAQSMKNYYGSMIADAPTPPGSPPVTSGSNTYETDIFTINTSTNTLGWQWIETDSSIPSPVYLYRMSGRLYPVGNSLVFLANTVASSGAKYEVFLKLVEVLEQE